MFSIAHLPLLLAACLFLAGCGHQTMFTPYGPAATVAGPTGPIGQNPFIAPVTDGEFVWNQVVDTLDDYFKIAREERVRAVGGVLTAGRIDTYPTTGATLLEPWRRDSTPGFERLHSTLQSVRRRAVVHVVPVERGFSIEVVVLKELEDLDRPEHASVAAPALRHDGSLVRTELAPARNPAVLGWIPLGRDLSLEQTILAQLQARLADSRPPGIM